MKLRKGELLQQQRDDEHAEIRLGITMEDYDSIYDGEEVLVFWLDSPSTHADNRYKTEKYHIGKLQEVP